MARFFVGQRVKLARPYQPRNLGKCGRIFELWPYAVESSSEGEWVNCSVHWDSGESDGGFDAPDGDATHTDQLEPILDEHQPAELTVHELLPFLRETNAPVRTVAELMRLTWQLIK